MLKTVVVAALAAISLWAQPAELAVLHKGASTLGFYSSESRLLADVPVGKHPHEMVLSADGRFLYISDNGTMRIEEPGTGSNTVSIVDVAARKKAGEISLGKFHRPHGIALGPKPGQLLVSAELPDALLVVDIAQRKVIRTFDVKGKTAHMVTLGPGGRWAYVSNSSSANVAAVELTTGKVKLIATGERPEGSVLAGDGRHLYVANRNANTITIIDTSNNEAAGEIKTGVGPVRIAQTPDGLLVYGLVDGMAVEIADALTKKVVGRVPVEGLLVSMHLSPDGKYALTSAEKKDTVYVVSIQARKIVRQFKTRAGANPDPVMALR